MKKLILSAVAVCFLAACATDPYTGESKVSKTAWGTGIGTLAGAGIGALVGGERVRWLVPVSARSAARVSAAIWIFRRAGCVKNWSEPACRCKKSATTFA